MGFYQFVLCDCSNIQKHGDLKGHRQTGTGLCYDYSTLSFWGFRHAVFLISQHWSCSGVSFYSKGRKVTAAGSRHGGGRDRRARSEEGRKRTSWIWLENGERSDGGN